MDEHETEIAPESKDDPALQGDRKILRAMVDAADREQCRRMIAAYSGPIAPPHEAASAEASPAGEPPQRKRRKSGGPSASAALFKALYDNMQQYPKGILFDSLMQAMRANGSISHNVTDQTMLSLLKRGPKTYMLQANGEWIYRPFLRPKAVASAG